MAALIAEFIGTFTLIFVGCAAILNGGGAPGLHPTLLGIALAHGLAIAVMGSATGHISGGHLNPAVTIAMLITGRIEATKALSYIVAQVLGAIVAALVVQVSLPGAALAGATPGIAKDVSLGAAILLEAIATFFLVFVIFGTAVDGRGPKMGALFIGLTVALDILAIGPLTGAAMNPARSIGPALIGGQLDNFWVYWVGPIIGAIVAAFTYSSTLENA